MCHIRSTEGARDRGRGAKWIVMRDNDKKAHRRPYRHNSCYTLRFSSVQSSCEWRAHSKLVHLLLAPTVHKSCQHRFCVAFTQFRLICLKATWPNNILTDWILLLSFLLPIAIEWRKKDPISMHRNRNGNGKLWWHIYHRLSFFFHAIVID